jgi:7,8-dihydropterin-6-yl-methyl-4-(beta-D-ribofuranosyl)aminobenzene 5'-phosphate synthase
MKDLESVDQIEFQVLVNNVTDSLSTGPKNVTHEWTALMRAGMRELASRKLC